MSKRKPETRRRRESTAARESTGAPETNRDPETADALTIGIEKLGILNYLGERSVSSLERRLTQFGDSKSTAESAPVRINFVEPRTVAHTFADEHRVGVRVRVTGEPGGYVIVLLAPESADRMLRVMLADTTEDVTTVSEEMAYSALVEFGGLVANAWLDGLADTFDRHIAASTPIVVNSTAVEVVDRVLDGEEDHGLYLATTMTIAPEEIEFEVYLFPENEAFVDLLDLVTFRREDG